MTPTAFLLLTALAAPAPAVQTTDDGAVRRVIADLYKATAKDGFSDPKVTARLAPELRRLVVEDRRRAGNEAGFIDFDPMCQCQDDSGLKVAIAKVLIQRAQATVTARNTFAGQAAGSSSTVTFRLVRSEGRWRLADVESLRTPSLRQWLARQLASAR